MASTEAMSLSGMKLLPASKLKHGPRPVTPSTSAAISGCLFARIREELTAVLWAKMVTLSHFPSLVATIASTKAGMSSVPICSNV